MGALLGLIWLRAKLVGRQFDCLLNAMLLPDAQPNQTMSVNASLHEQSTRWGCVLCRLLGVIVQRHHCAKVRRAAPMPVLADLRAIGAMLCLVCLIAGGVLEASKGAVFIIRLIMRG